MAGENRILDDLSKLMTNAMGVAHGAKTEAETAFKGWVDRWLADRDFVTREEFEAVREMAVKARTEAAELRARLDAMEGKPAAAAGTGGAAAHGIPGYGSSPGGAVGAGAAASAVPGAHQGSPKAGAQPGRPAMGGADHEGGYHGGADHGGGNHEGADHEGAGRPEPVTTPADTEHDAQLAVEGTLPPFGPTGEVSGA